MARSRCDPGALDPNTPPRSGGGWRFELSAHRNRGQEMNTIFRRNDSGLIDEIIFAPEWEIGPLKLNGRALTILVGDSEVLYSVLHAICAEAVGIPPELVAGKANHISVVSDHSSVAEEGHLLSRKWDCNCSFFVTHAIGAEWHPLTAARKLPTRRMCHEKRGEQEIASCFNPYIVDAAQWDEVVVAFDTAKTTGQIGFKSITDHPEYESYKKAMAPGEFWAMVGEDWQRKRKA